jgi:hypothetical protein
VGGLERILSFRSAVMKMPRFYTVRQIKKKKYAKGNIKPQKIQEKLPIHFLSFQVAVY